MDAIKKMNIEIGRNVLDDIFSSTLAFVKSKTKEERNKYGQFFTAKLIAEFMASMFYVDFSKNKLKILDAGSGSGILASALVQNLRFAGYSGVIETRWRN